MITSLVLALTTISRNRLRAGLTVLGILIGVAALIAVMALAAGVSAKIAGSMQAYASNSLSINTITPPSGNRQTIPKRLTESDAKAILQQARSVSSVAVHPGDIRIGRQPGAARGQRVVGQPPQVLDERQLEHARPRPELADAQRRDPLKARDEDGELLPIDAAVAMAQELDRHGVDARMP